MMSKKNKAIETRAILKNAWLKQLAKEYQVLLSRPGLKNLKPAVLSLGQGTTYWGQWRSETRRIVISEQLITIAPWTAVQGILGHELAHQIVDELLKGHALSEPHGSAFIKACDIVGLNDYYRHPSINLTSSRPADPEEKTTNNSKTINIVKKLLALANSPVPAEAEAAMLKAAKIIAKYNLNLQNTDKKYNYKIINTERQRFSTTEARITGILTEFYFVEIILSSLYNPHLNIEEKTIEIFGRLENVAMAEYVYEFLKRSLNNLWKTAAKKGFKSRTSFSLGLLKGFADKLKQQATHLTTIDFASEDLSALMISNDQQLKTFVRRRHPKLKSVRYQGGPQNAQSHNEGYQIGKNLIINRPLNSGNNGKISGLLDN